MKKILYILIFYIISLPIYGQIQADEQKNDV
jgi:hypothetical protein